MLQFARHTDSERQVLEGLLEKRASLETDVDALTYERESLASETRDLREQLSRMRR